MSLAEIREPIEELSFEDRVEPAEWLAATTAADDLAPEVEAESVRLAEKRLADLEVGLAHCISEDEVWRRAAARRAERTGFVKISIISTSPKVADSAVLTSINFLSICFIELCPIKAWHGFS